LPAVVEPAADPLRHLDAGDLVVQELRVPERLQGQDTDQQRHLRHAAEAVEEALPAVQLVHRLRHHELHAGVQLALEALQLLRRGRRRWG
jgi:hypothetical protein